MTLFMEETPGDEQPLFNSLVDALTYWAEKTPDATAVETLNNGCLSYAQLLEQAQSLALGLKGLGLRSGDRVAIQLPSQPEFIVTYFACQLMGYVLATMHIPYRREELRPLMEFAEPKAVVTATIGQYDAPATMMQLVQQISSLEHVIVVGQAGEGQIAWADLLERFPSQTTILPVSGDCDAAMCFTSGTSAAPKAVLRTQDCFARNAATFAKLLHITREDRVMIAPPLTHVFGLSCAGNAIYSGATILPVPIFSPDIYARYLFELKPTIIYSAPAHLAATLKSGAMDRQSADTVRDVIVGGAICPPMVAAQFEAKLPNGRVGCLFGMTETTLCTQTVPSDPAQIRHNSVGKAAPGMKVRIVDHETGLAVANGIEGEMQISGYSLMRGYVGNHAANRDVFTPDGWFRSGDTAYLDADGNITITGRLKDIINRGGIKINPSDIESLLDAHEAIVQSAIVPMPDEILGERLCAYVVLKPNVFLTLDQLCAYLARRSVAKMRWPERLEIIDAMPMTPTRKIIKSILVEDIKQKLENDNGIRENQQQKRLRA